MTMPDLTLCYQITFDDFRQAQRGHLAARGGAWLRWTVVALGLVLVAGVGTLLAVGPARPPGVLGPLLDLVRLLVLPLAPWLLIVTYVVGFFIISQRHPRARVIDVVRQTRPRWFKPQVATLWTLVVVVAFSLVGQGLINVPPDQPRTERLVGLLLPILPYGALMLFLWLFFYRRVLRKAYVAQQAKMERPVTTTITADRVTFDDVLTTLSYRWPAFVRCVESADLFLLYTTEVTFFMIPKRAFASAGDMDRFRQWVADWAQSRSEGFPVLSVPVMPMPMPMVATE